VIGLAHRIISVEDLLLNPFNLIGKDWMLISSGSKDSFNMMTAGWGGLGILWGKKVIFCFIRPTRYTYKFVNENDLFTVSFFSSEYREALNICGRYSGRDVDKVKLSGLIPVEDNEYRTVYYDQARLVFICKKIYYQDINPDNFLDESIHNNYPMKDYHRMFVGEIVKALEER
jgi:flavin reductase (DIM6/NTAB) family NADH-FMN oxidoreductase RutF